ncbi:Lrp/AsnC family transcriptional regulator [Actinoallomurus rhizosphaericola]|uniref:Lrp/AsnC family transcriptional regulator n=1 Tax=Actinoallomurus rhizosphaericola TaxID=2952536 RepID=UPI002092A25F|nr:Lrp/AsnC family transcriptional regulator [Actinoallomurus rhizosphaericola]MCO5999503.1 Lrp/AsnC family transcriptional regulator [Actinoallomurus rhizosphaericola]
MDHLSFEATGDPGPAGRTAPPLDDVDRAILRELENDGRMSMRTLAERVSVSRSNVYARVERLVAEGVITGFTARIDPVRAGLGTAAYVLLTIEQHSWREVTARLREVPYIEHLAFVGGDVDLVMLVRTPDNVTLRDVVLARIHALPGIRSTRTWLIFDEAAGSRRLH